MTDYLLIFRSRPDFAHASPEQLQQSMLKWQEWLEDLDDQNKLGKGERLLAGGTVLSGRTKEIVDGPISERREIIAGFQIIKAGSLHEAIDTARGCPIFESGGSVEVREPAHG